MAVVAFKAEGDGVGVFLVDGQALDAVDLLPAVVVAGLDAGEDLLAVHDVGFEKEDGAFVESVGEQVAGPEVGIVGDVDGAQGERFVLVGRKGGDLLECADQLDGEGFFLGMDSLCDLQEHFESFVIVGDLAPGVCAIEEDVEVIAG